MRPPDFAQNGVERQKRTCGSRWATGGAGPGAIRPSSAPQCVSPSAGGKKSMGSFKTHSICKFRKPGQFRKAGTAEVSLESGTRPSADIIRVTYS